MYLMIEYATDVAYIVYCSIIYMLYKEGYVMDFLIKVVACFLAGAGAGIGTGLLFYDRRTCGKSVQLAGRR